MLKLILCEILINFELIMLYSIVKIDTITKLAGPIWSDIARYSITIC